MDEASLTERMAQGDQEALAEFIELKQGPLHAFIDRNLGVALRRRVEPLDVFQEVSVECLRSLDSVDFGGKDPFGWLCQVAERKIIDLYRRHFGAKKRDASREKALGSPGGDTQQAGLVDLLVITMTTPSQAFSRDERQQKLREALELLPPLNREALRLRYVEGLPSKEIAEHLEKTDGAVRVLLTRSLKRLEELLGSLD